MKTHLRALAATILFCLQMGLLMAVEKPDCPDNSCFDTQIISEEKDGDCTTYTLEISQDGSCRYGLSHFNIEVGCGQITDVSNSEGWAMEIGTKDPTTGITGIKIDDIKKFGENKSPQSFTVTYIICDTGNCTPEELVPARVAYKASTCVHYQDVTPIYTPMSASLLPTDASCATTADGNIDLQLEGGTAPYTYAWSNGATTEDLISVAAGTYSVTVTDATGETLSLQAQVFAPAALSISFSTSSPYCTHSDGSIDLSVEGGSGEYAYEWSNGATTEDLENLAAGEYSVTVTDSGGCSSTASISLSAAASTISLEFNTKQPTCQGNEDGSIDLTVGGSGEYTYEWSNGATSEDLDQLGAGDYTVIVTESNGCTTSGTISLAAPRAIFIRPLSTVHANCLGEGGSLTVEASFGTAPYTYEWSNGETGASISNLEPGYYTVRVTDDNNCTNQRRFSISQESGPSVSISSGGCGNEFQLSAVVSGGTAPYTYEWSNGESSLGTTVAAGTHSVTVTDATGCSSTASISLQEADTALKLEAEVSHVSCAGGSNGSATILVSGGVAPYSFDWSNQQEGSTATNLKAGLYSVLVKDNNGCENQLAFSVSEPAALSITAIVSNNESCAEPTGSIEIEVNGGTEPYSFEWNTGKHESNLSDLAAGSYTLTVSDANNCVAIRSFTLEDVNNNSDLLASLQPATESTLCKGDSTTISVEFTGEGPYSFVYADGLAAYSITTNVNPYLLEVTPESTTTYSLLSISNSCGQGVASGKTTVEVEDCPTGKTPVCEDGCFSTEIISNVSDGNCQTITLQVNSNGNCRYALSHFNIALSCGTASEVSNSGGWPMEINAYDPTTGIYGIKIDDINNFGEDKEPQSFTVTYTVCSDDESCQESLKKENLKLGYKAGQCAYYNEAEQPQQPWDFSPGVIVVVPDFLLYPNPLSPDGTLNLKVIDVYSTETATLTISSIEGIKVHQQQYEVSELDNLISISFQYLPPGTYVVKMEIKGYVVTKQLYVL